MTATTEALTETQKIAAHMRAVVAVLDTFPSHVEAPTHTNTASYLRTPEIAWLLFDQQDDQKARAAAIMRALGGTWEKEPGRLFGFKTERDGVRLHISVDREAVCERVVTGTHEVTHEVPDPAAAVPMVTVTETVEDFEWVCAPVLGGAA